MTDGITLTLSETQALCAKAMRGAGHPWALADEAGRAAAWLAGHGLPGATLILRLAQGPAGAAPEPAVGHWASPGPLCPVRAGVALADHARLPEGPRGPGLRLGRVVHPGLLLPFAALTARLAGTGLALHFGADPLLIGAGGTLSGPAAGLCAMTGADLTLAPAVVPEGKAPRVPLPNVPATVWQALERLALRTTVPPSATSRGGAGAAGSDND